MTGTCFWAYFAKCTTGGQASTSPTNTDTQHWLNVPLALCLFADPGVSERGVRDAKIVCALAGVVVSLRRCTREGCTATIDPRYDCDRCWRHRFKLPAERDSVTPTTTSERAGSGDGGSRR